MVTVFLRRNFRDSAAAPGKSVKYSCLATLHNISCNLFPKYLSCHHCESSTYTIIILSERKAIMLFASQEKGQGLVEYAIILLLVALIIIAVLRLLGPSLGDSYSAINNSVP
jgi:pilus assembly protein Flp/PilA